MHNCAGVARVLVGHRVVIAALGNGSGVEQHHIAEIDDLAVVERDVLSLGWRAGVILPVGDCHGGAGVLRRCNLDIAANAAFCAVIDQQHPLTGQVFFVDLDTRH